MSYEATADIKAEANGLRPPPFELPVRSDRFDYMPSTNHLCQYPDQPELITANALKLCDLMQNE